MCFVWGTRKESVTVLAARIRAKQTTGVLSFHVLWQFWCVMQIV